MRRWWPVLLLLAGATWICAAMWRVPWWQSHENVCYPVRLVEYLDSWRAGHWYPRWCADFSGGYGNPFFNFYSPGVYAPAALISLFGVAPTAAFKVVMLVATLGGTAAMYGAILGETDRVDAALVGGALFVFLPYRVTDLFVRGDLAEYAAFCLVPLALWGLRALTRAMRAGDARRAAWGAIAAALALAGVVLAHTVTGLFATELAGLYTLSLFWRERRAAWLAAAAIALSVGIAAVYVGPALFEQGLVHIEALHWWKLATGRNMVPLRAFVHDPFFSLGAPFLVGVIAWSGAFVLPQTRATARRAAVWWIVPLVLLFLMLPWCRAAWRVIPFGQQIQFPWRLLGLVGVFGAVGLGVLWAGIVPSSRAGLVAAVVVLAPLPLVVQSRRAVGPADPIPSTAEVLRMPGFTTTATGEYIPRDVPIGGNPIRVAEAWSTSPGVLVRSERPDALHRDFTFDATGTADITLGTFAFKGWELDDASAGVRLVERDGLYHLLADGPGHFEAHLSFHVTPLRRAASIVSLLALLATFLVLPRLARRLVG
ncbi:MAG TPA: 6-pyruvoyl-tetrahydropterin synthase-related protein [Kofleriaceae bacterium]|jgi:hypothetical protein